MFFILTARIAFFVLKEPRAILALLATTILFVMSQVTRYVFSGMICYATKAKLDGNWVATLLETASLIFLYYSWTQLTEDYWDGDKKPVV